MNKPIYFKCKTLNIYKTAFKCFPFIFTVIKNKILMYLNEYLNITNFDINKLFHTVF